MTAAVAPPPQPLDSSALARKRRREILSSQRVSVDPDVSPSSDDAAAEASPSFDEPPRAKRRVLEEFMKTESDQPAKPKKVQKRSGSKKPQMKYDPDVPMTKEEAAAWRREQRRKRNRESAAASRQRQRDRIAELEVEVEEWKTKFNDAMEKLRKLEAGADLSPSELLSTSLPDVAEKTFVSPSSTPNTSPRASPTVSPIVSCSLVDAGRLSKAGGSQQHQISKEEGEEQHLINMISLPAVKITGEASTPLLPEDSLFAGSNRPDSCRSSEIKLPEIKLAAATVLSDPTDTKEESLPSLPCLMSHEDDESELGEFLLDAVQWL